jgi:hypothetical protein
LALVHKAAFELLSVRTGPGAQPPYRCIGGPQPEFTVEGVRKETRDLLKRLDGEEGRQVRTNLEVLGKLSDSAWAEGGSAKQEMNGFLRAYID